MLRADIMRVTHEYKAGEGVLRSLFTTDKLVSGSSLEGKFFFKKQESSEL